MSAGTSCTKSRGVAQSVARLLWEQEVRGSSPRTPTSSTSLLSANNTMHPTLAGVTQLVEFLPSKQAVAGSSPVSRSKSYTVSLQALLKPSGGNQTAMGNAGGGFCFDAKAFNESLPTRCALPHQNLPRSVPFRLSLPGYRWRCHEFRSVLITSGQTTPQPLYSRQKDESREASGRRAVACDPWLLDRE